MNPGRGRWAAVLATVIVHRAWVVSAAFTPVDPAALPPPAARDVSFAADIQPIFEDACVSCHGPERPRSGFRLDNPRAALAGGRNGLAILPGDGGGSPLVHYVARIVEDLQMPPKGKGDPLTSEQVGLLRKWIDQGAPWPPETSPPAPLAADPRDTWWSVAPLNRPAIPERRLRDARIHNAVDAFVVAGLHENQLRQSPEADRRTLIRRLYFDLVGLPPTPAEIEAFVANPDPGAYESLVERLLDSPHYGERWARHWLDVVHYGETHGYDKDQPRPNAWPYRDYVIRSFNQDKPYSQFVAEQVAGDVLFPGTRDGFEALGFLSSGPWDLIGHAEVPESKIDGRIARHLDRDDMVTTTLQTFNSFTVQCAQCHDHRFDPVSQEDYYSLQAVFAAVDRADQEYDPDPEVAQTRRYLEDRVARLTAQMKSLTDVIQARAGTPLTDLDHQIAALTRTTGKHEAYGYHSAIESRPDTIKWVQVDLGEPAPLARIVLYPCQDDFNAIGAGFGFPVRFKVEVSDDPAFLENVEIVGDSTAADFANPGLDPHSLDASGHAARFIRVTATRLAFRQDDYIFALAELNAITTRGANVALGAAVSALDSIEAPARWRKQNLTDGWQPGAPVTDSARLTELRQERAAILAAATSEEERIQTVQIESQLAATQPELEQLPARSKAYVAAVYTGSGAFAGTGANGGRPRPIHLLHRGNVQRPGREMEPGALSCLQGMPSRFDLPPDHREGDRRAALARWLTSPNNPLTWRSIVNRVWQYHFGAGLVASPNDFGRMGALPSHPDLLDWLAVEFRDGGQSLKSLHRLLVTSAAYRQSSLADAALAEIDSDNRYLWRANRRKLEAEAVRDSILLVSGKLDRTMGGPSFQDFVIERPEHSPHYQYHLHEPDDPGSHRRSVYRFIVRSQPQPFMAALDCADPSMQVGRRSESVSTLQALALLNDAFVLSRSRDFAANVERDGGDLPTKVRRAHAEAIGRAPEAGEQVALDRYAQSFGLTNLCRVLFNLNEFAFVD